MKIEKHSYVTKINLYIIKGSLVEKLPSYRALYIYTLVIQRCVTEHAVSAKYTDNCRFWPYCATYLQNFVGSLWLSCLPNKTARQHVLLCLTTYVSARASNFCHSCACMGCMMHVCKTVFRSGGHDISTRADSNIRQHYAVGAQTAVQGTALDPYGSPCQAKPGPTKCFPLPLEPINTSAFVRHPSCGRSSETIGASPLKAGSETPEQQHAGFEPMPSKTHTEKVPNVTFGIH